MARVPFLVCALLGIALGATAARADPFDYAVDRFEVDGNLNGPFDGTPDVVDEFDDGVLAPWGIRRGSASESGDAAHVTSPGLNIALPGIFPVAFEASAIGTSGRLHVGSGDAVLRVVLAPQAILGNDALSFDFSSTTWQAFYYTGIVLTNFNTTLANAFGPPYPIGLAATAHSERLSFTNEVLARQHHPIDPGSVTGPIVLELRYTDATHEVTPALSVDGGTTYEAVFDPLEVESDSGDVVVQVAVAALEGECPADHKVRLLKLSRLGRGPGRQKLRLRSVFPSPIYQGLRPIRFVVTDEGNGGATVYDVTVPDRNTAFQQGCDPGDGWISSGYVNVSGALPPSCAPGSAQGLRRLRMRWNGSLDLRLEVVDTTLPSVVGPLRVTIYSGTAPVNECDGWVGDASCKAAPSRVKCATP